MRLAGRRARPETGVVSAPRQESCDLSCDPGVDSDGNVNPPRFEHHVVAHVGKEACLCSVPAAVARTSSLVSAASFSPSRTSSGVVTREGLTRTNIPPAPARLLPGCTRAAQASTVTWGVLSQNRDSRARRGRRDRGSPRVPAHYAQCHCRSSHPLRRVRRQQDRGWGAAVLEVFLYAEPPRECPMSTGSEPSMSTALRTSST